MCTTLGYQRDDCEGELEQITMVVYVIQKEEEEHHEPPADIGIIIEGVKVLNELPSVTSACALLLGMIYIINLAHPKPSLYIRGIPERPAEDVTKGSKSFL